MAAPGSMGSGEKTIRLAVDPALTGTFTVQLADGTPAEVTTVFELLKRTLEDYPLAKVAGITGLPEHEILRPSPASSARASPP